MLKPLHRHLIYYRNIEWARQGMGVTCFHAVQEINSYKVSQVKVKADVSKMHFVILWNKSIWKQWDCSSSPSPSPHFPLSSLRVFNYFNLHFHAGETQVPRWKKKKKKKKKEKLSRVLPRVELALMRFSCNYFSATTIRTTTTEDLIRQWEGLMLLPGDSD